MLSHRQPRAKLTFAGASTATSNPHTSIQKSIPLVAGFQFNGHPDLVLVGRDLICLDIVVQAFEHFFRPRPPAFRPGGDIGGRVVVGLQEVGGVDACRQIADD